MRFRKINSALMIIGVVGFFSSGVQAQDNEALLAGFHPYREGKPQVEGITPGLQISKDNAQVAEKVLK